MQAVQVTETLIRMAINKIVIRMAQKYLLQSRLFSLFTSVKLLSE